MIWRKRPNPELSVMLTLGYRISVRFQMKILFVFAVFACVTGNALALSVDCGAIDEKLATMQSTKHPKGYEVVVRLPSFYKEFELTGVDIGQGELISVSTHLWPGQDGEQFAVFYAAGSAASVSVVAHYSAGACHRRMAQQFTSKIRGYAKPET